MKKKILVITGSRAEYGLLRATLKSMQENKQLELQLLVTGMHLLQDYGLTINEILKDQLPVTYKVPISQGKNMLTWLTEEIAGIYKICSTHRPDLILVLGDRDEPLAGAIVGAHLGIPVAHIHGGDITGENTIDDKIRDAITSFSKLHFPVSQKSAERIRHILGHKSKNIIVVGSVGHEEMTDVLEKKVIAAKYHLSLNQPWILFVMHPSPLDSTKPIDQIRPVIQALKNVDAEIFGIYPNSDTGSDVFLKEMKALNKFSQLQPSIPRKDYLSILKYSHCIVGNSSSGCLETPYYNTYSLNIGKRQNGRSNYKHMTTVDYDTKSIHTAITRFLKLPKKSSVQRKLNRNPSQIIVSHINTYLEYAYK